VLPKKKWSREPHETWQLDGKEQVLLGDGTLVSWMNMGDEATGAHLKATVHENRLVAEIGLQNAILGVNACFERWGLPLNLKIDNGRPLVNPHSPDVPTKAVLWWTGLGINVVQNDKGCPQQNGIVECLQGTMGRWSNPGAQPNAKALQVRLDEESDFQRKHYRIPSKGHRTRMELYPELEGNGRRYNPEMFEIERVYVFLSQKVWERRVKNSGDVKIFGESIYVGTKHSQQPVTIVFDPIEKEWLVNKLDGTFLRASKRGVPNEKEIKEFALISKNLGTT